MPSDADSKKKKRKIKMVTCIRCGRYARYGGPGPICNACHVKEYKERTGYKGPIRACKECGEITNIWGHGLCRKCYNRQYGMQHRKELTQKQHERRLADPEKFRARDRKWFAKHREQIRERRKKLYHEHLEERRAEKRKYYREHAEEIKINLRKKSRLSPCTKADKKVSLEQRLKQIPSMKLVHVKEFLNTAYADRTEVTKHKLLKSVVKLIAFEKKIGFSTYCAPWNTMKLETVDRCQVEDGMLSDSLRVFFRWLKKRKYLSVDLSQAIPTQTKKGRRVSRVSLSTLSELATKWYTGQGELPELIAGLLIIFNLLRVNQMRYLKMSHLHDGYITVDGKDQMVDRTLWGYIQKYMAWRKYMYGDYTPEYFFITGESVTKKSPVSNTYFSLLFRRNHVGVSPSTLRQAMIYYHKKKTGLDPFSLGAVAGITPRAAAVYYNK